MKTSHLLSFAWILLIYSCTSADNNKKKIPPQSVISVPLYFDFNNDFFASASTTVFVSNSNDNIIFEYKGYRTEWGEVRPAGKLTLTGKYKVHVTYYTDSVTKKEFEDFFEIKGDEVKAELTVNLINAPPQERNQIYLNKFYDNKYNVLLKRIWNPQKQFSSKQSMLPDYEWTNNYDSAIFGIYRQYSSSLTTSWNRLWDIGFMGFEKYTDSGWIRLSCNAPRIEANISKGKTGKTLKDMDLLCSWKEFKKGKYRISIQYGINDAIDRTTKGSGKLESCFFYEPHIYQVSDQFTIN